MKVSLVSKTCPTSEFEGSTIEEILVYMARVSSPKDTVEKLKDPDKLINYLIKHKHWSPFDMVNICFEVHTSRSIGRQILRHWSIKPQEFSQRYAESTMPKSIEMRRAGSNNRQSSTEVEGVIYKTSKKGFDYESTSTDHIVMDALGRAAYAMTAVEAAYDALLKAGIATECAREILPMATPTVMMLNGSLRSWIHFLDVRLDEHSQKEIRLIAEDILPILKRECPFTMRACGY